MLGHPSSAETLTEIGDQGVLALVCNSTNAFLNEASGSESSVHEALRNEVMKARGRVLITTFASNAARLETIGRVAIETNRRVVVAGRSLDRILQGRQGHRLPARFPRADALRRGDAAAQGRSADHRHRRAGRVRAPRWPASPSASMS